MEKDLGKRLTEIVESIDEETIKSANNEELMGYSLTYIATHGNDDNLPGE